MIGLTGFLERAATEPSVQPDRPPEPEPLYQYDDGNGVLLTDDPEDPLTSARITADSSSVMDLEAWA